MYSRLILMLSISFVMMYASMYAMVDRYENLYHNINQIYMAVLATSIMAITEIWTMLPMYNNIKTNIVITVVAGIFMVLSFVGIRRQILVTDKQFLRSMIPHHASAILMCENNKVKDPEIKKLCENIVSSQQKEIDWMKNKL